MSDPDALVWSPARFAAHCRTCTVLDSRYGEPVALGHVDEAGTPLVTRIWRRKGLLSSDVLRPYADRFRFALEELARRGVAVPACRAHGRVAQGEVRFVICEALNGTPLRRLDGQVEIKALAEFVAHLHQQGVYCRSLHLGNLVRLGDGGIGLVDVQDTRFCSGPLTLRQRERNLGILCSHPEDLAWMRQGGSWSELVMAYSRASHLSLAQAADLRERVRLQIERRGARRALRRRQDFPASAAEILSPQGVRGR